MAATCPREHVMSVRSDGRGQVAEVAVGQIADYLLLQSHSAVGLVDRAEAAGFVRRCPDPGDARVSLVAAGKVRGPSTLAVFASWWGRIWEEARRRPVRLTGRAGMWPGSRRDHRPRRAGSADAA